MIRRRRNIRIRMRITGEMSMPPKFGRNDRIGIMLHHKVMDADAFGFLDRLLAELRRYPFVHFHTFQSLSAPRNE